MYYFKCLFCNCYKKKITPEELQITKQKRNELLLTFQSNTILRNTNKIF